MAQHGPPSSSHPDPSSGPVRAEAYGDPWQAFGYLVSGVLFYGILGWLLDRWLDTQYLVVVGIFVGAGLGLYLSFGRFGQGARSAGQDSGTQDQDQEEE